MENDIRWLQRLNNYTKALSTLIDDVNLLKERELSDIEKRGIIQSFEYTHELAWKVLKDFLTEYGGHTGIVGSRDTTREAFKQELIEDGELWMEMIKSRNLSSHTYNEDTAETVVEQIPDFCAAFQSLNRKLTEYKDKR